MDKRKHALRAYNIIVIALLGIGLIYVCSRFVHLGTVEYTDNAMVNRNITPINTRVQRFIKEIRFNVLVVIMELVELSKEVMTVHTAKHWAFSGQNTYIEDGFISNRI